MAKTLTSAIDVARFLIHLAQTGDEPECLSPMRLQKLLYYVQAWSLVRRGTPMFKEKLQAWPYGPVVPEVFHKFKVHGRNAIPADEGVCDTLTDEERLFVKRVWDIYKPYSAISLSQMTHAETPWLDARGDLSPSEKCSKEISHKSMEAYFSERAKKS